jgi:hypothetical protein
MAGRGRPIGTTTPIKDRLLRKIVINEYTDCWEWQGGKNNVGYGLIRDEHGMRTTHRVSYELYKGNIPKNLCVLHSCDNPKCVNPEHLRLGTRKDNTQDMISKGRTNYIGMHKPMTCVHCGFTTTPPMIARWHDNNCKHKPNSINTISTKSTNACA